MKNILTQLSNKKSKQPKIEVKWGEIRIVEKCSITNKVDGKNKYFH